MPKYVTYEIEKIGRKWLTGRADGTEYRNKILKNEVSQDYEIGQIYTFFAKFELVGEYKGSRTFNIIPLSDDKLRKGADAWLSGYENAAARGQKDQAALDWLEDAGCADQLEIKKRICAADEVRRAVWNLRKWTDYILERAKKGWKYDKAVDVVKENIGIIYLNASKENFSVALKNAMTEWAQLCITAPEGANVITLEECGGAGFKFCERNKLWDEIEPSWQALGVLKREKTPGIANVAYDYSYKEWWVEFDFRRRQQLINEAEAREKAARGSGGV